MRTCLVGMPRAALGRIIAPSAKKAMTSAAPSRSAWTGVPMGPPDGILGLVEAFKADTHPNKVNLSVGAYRDSDGQPWVLPSVLKAEEHVMAKQMNKEYLPIIGDADFVDNARRFALGSASPALTEKRVASVQSLSGTGACRVIGDFYAKFLGKGAPFYLPTPSWGNHANIFRDSGLDVRSYRYWDKETLGLDLDGMLADLKSAPDGSAVLLHACAHNPTGVDPTPEQWKTICSVLKERPGLSLFFDSAYQGFASGDAEADAFALRHFVSEGVPCALAQSFAKNFGLYGERVGTLSVACADAEEAARVLSQLKLIVRPMYSSPPIHGALIVQEVLGDDALRGQYYGECAAMAERIGGMRKALRAELEAAGSTHDWGHVTDQIGMFAFTGMNAAMCDELTEDHSIFLTRECAPALPRPFSPTPAPRLPRACPLGWCSPPLCPRRSPPLPPPLLAVGASPSLGSIRATSLPSHVPSVYASDVRRLPPPDGARHVP